MALTSSAVVCIHQPWCAKGGIMWCGVGTACLGLRQGPMLTAENFKMVRRSEGRLLLSPLFPHPTSTSHPSPCRDCSEPERSIPNLYPPFSPLGGQPSVCSAAHAASFTGLGGLGLKKSVKFLSTVGNAPNPGTCLPQPASELEAGGDLIFSPWPSVGLEAAPDGDGWYPCNLAGQNRQCRKEDL